MKDALFPIPKDLLAKLHKANSEPTVRQLVIQQLDCDDIELEKSGTDALHKNILFEFKHDVDMRYKEGERARVLAQALYYWHKPSRIILTSFLPDIFWNYQNKKKMRLSKCQTH